MPRRHLGPLLAATLLAAPAVTSAATLPVQGILRAAGGGPVADGTYVVVASLYDAPDAPKHVWQELQKKVAVGGGFFAFNLGTATPVDDKLLLAGKPLWLGVQVGGDDELPRVALQGAPKAWHATVAAGLDCSGCIQGAHVGFAYAGSQSKGGPADEALHAKNADMADTAKTAESAKVADAAKAAEVAAKAESAAIASVLQCTGCVTLQHLHQDVANGFVSTKGGTIDGKLTVAKGLALGSSVIEGGRFEAGDVAKTACAPEHLGRMLVDGASKRLYFCDGGKFRKLLWCTGECKAQVLVPCGQPIVDDCGDPGQCTGKGTLCAPGEVCGNGKCAALGESPESAAASCKALLDAKPGTPDGSYWIEGAGGQAPAKLPCDMKNGGWTRVAYDDFEQSAGGWNPGPITTCGAWGKILGGYGQFGQGASTTKTYSGLPAHTNARVDAVFVRLDSWDGEEARMLLEGSIAWAKAGVHSNGAGQMCGADNGWKDELISATAQIGHTKGTLAVSFTSTLDQDPGDESWGVDNVAVWVK
jgi:hypothetical protein